VIPTKDRADLLGPCLSGILSTQSKYDGKLEIIVIDQESADATVKALLRSLRNTITVLPFRGELDWSALNNFAVSACGNAEVSIFLNNDILARIPRMELRFCPHFRQFWVKIQVA
jgi:glycosyltransferase involved in cell wall biosynthesis